MRLYSCWCAARSADVSAAHSADVPDPGTARLRSSGLLAPRHRMAKLPVRCLLPCVRSWTAQALFAWTRAHDEPRRSGQCGYIAAGLLRAALTCLLHTALTCLLHTALTCLIRAPRACAVLDCWRQGIAWQRLPVRCLLPCVRALREKENFQLFHFVQPLKMVHSFGCLSVAKTFCASLACSNKLWARKTFSICRTRMPQCTCNTDRPFRWHFAGSQTKGKRRTQNRPAVWLLRELSALTISNRTTDLSDIPTDP